MGHVTAVGQGCYLGAAGVRLTACPCAGAMEMMLFGVSGLIPRYPLTPLRKGHQHAIRECLRGIRKQEVHGPDPDPHFCLWSKLLAVAAYNCDLCCREQTLAMLCSGLLSGMQDSGSVAYGEGGRRSRWMGFGDFCVMVGRSKLNVGRY